jgi:hypothetical protein
MVSFAKIEHARRVKKKHKITGARSLFFNPFARRGGPEKSNPPPCFLRSNAKDSVCVFPFSFKKPSREK